MDKVLASFRRNLAGKVRNKAQLDNMIREVFVPGSTKDASARELAQGWQEAAEYLRKRFNAAGGAIPKRSDWGMPQQHHSLKVRQAGFEAWRDTITPMLNLEKMIDQQTGLTFSPKIRNNVTDVYETISTDGMSRSSQWSTRAKAPANQHAQHRFSI